MALLKTRVKFPGVASGTQMPSPWAARTLQMPHCQGLTIWATVLQLPRGEEMGTDRMDWYINAWAIPRLVFFRGLIQMLQQVYKHPDIFTWESPASPHTPLPPYPPSPRRQPLPGRELVVQDFIQWSTVFQKMSIPSPRKLEILKARPF